MQVEFGPTQFTVSTLVVYDVLRSNDPADFGAAATCLESDDAANTHALDIETPIPGTVNYYLIRVENGCLTAQLGDATAGERIARDCP